MTKLFDFKSGN